VAPEVEERKEIRRLEDLLRISRTAGKGLRGDAPVLQAKVETSRPPACSDGYHDSMAAALTRVRRG
jgi:hypothetical protein